MPSKTPTSTYFTGFPAETIDFLRGLAANNEKPWLDAHRAEYDRYYVEPAIAFVSAIGPRLQTEVSSSIQFESRINGSLFRINRDIRFSKDKTPYKTHLDMWFWEGDRKGWESTGLFLRLNAGLVAPRGRYAPPDAGPAKSLSKRGA